MSKYCLMYHPKVPVKNIVPVLTLNNLLQEVNHVNTIDRSNHTSGKKNLLAKIVRLNWMVENLKNESLYKPLLTVLRQGNLITVTGDTRLQAIELLPHITHIPCLASIPVDMQENFKYWDPVDTNQTLAEYLNIDPDNIVVTQDWNTCELDWIEFDLQETSTHMHNENQRLRMIYNYVDQQTADFCFTREWLQTPINWNQYDF